tara:strand:- start:269 stop:2257 length:1989 start_codon:yes stop_codon:yes gene_type:complete
MKSFIQELQERKVVRTTIGYSVVAFIIMQLVEIIFPIFEFPNWTSKFIIILLFLGFPIVIVLSWVFDVENKKIKKSPQSNNVYLLTVIVLLATCLLYIGFDGFLLSNKEKQNPFDEIDVNSIAVLPFDNYSEDKKDDHFSDGFTELIIANLAKINDLTVISRTSVMQYKNTRQSLKEIGKELGVANILEGSLHRVGEKIRIVAQLIDTRTDKHLWAENYEGTVSDIFTIQANVAEKIAKALQANVTSVERERILSKMTNNAEAYQLYSMGTTLMKVSEEEKDFRMALNFFEEALKLDQNFADAYGYAAYVHQALYWYGYDRNIEPLKISKEYIDKGLKLDPNSPVLYATRGYYHYWVNRDYTRALEDFIYARDAVPNNAEYIANIGWIERRLGRFDNAIDNFLAGYKVDPKWVAILTSLSMTYDALNDRKNAKKFLQEAIENYPSASYVHGMKIRWNFEDNKETREAKIAIENAIISTDIGAIMDIILQVYIFEKDYKTPLDLLKNLERNIFTHQSSLNAKDYYIGMLYDLMGENKLAISYYKSALSILEKKLNENIGDAMLHAAISRVYIRLGLIEEAVKSAQLSVALVSPARDAWYGVINKTNLAYIYESSNLIDDALHTLSEVYNKPFGPKKAELLLYWEWENLRTNSRFQSMIKNNNI